MKDTEISWTDHTFNPLWGCTKVSPACDHCYAEAWDKRYGGDHWGKGAPRRTFGDAHWQEAGQIMEADRFTRLGKKKAGNLFQGKTWLELPRCLGNSVSAAESGEQPQ